METVEFLGREIDVYYDYDYAEPDVGLSERITIWKIEYKERKIHNILSSDSLEEIGDLVWKEIDKRR